MHSPRPHPPFCSLATAAATGWRQWRRRGARLPNTPDTDAASSQPSSPWVHDAPAAPGAARASTPSATAHAAAAIVGEARRVIVRSFVCASGRVQHGGRTTSMREVGLQRLPGSANFQQGAVQTAGRRKTTTPHGVNDHRGTMAHAAKKQKQEDFQPRLRYGESCAPALRCDLLVLCGGRRTRVTTTPSSYR